MARKPSPSKRKAAARRTAPKRAGAKRAARRAAAQPPPKPGGYVHIELYSDIPVATKRFYADVFGWRFEKQSFGEGMSYDGYRTPGTVHGGLIPRFEGPVQPPSVLTYIGVDSVDKAEQRIAKAGGKVLMSKYEIPNVGWMAMFEAPGGVVQAVWEPHPKFARQP